MSEIEFVGNFTNTHDSWTVVSSAEEVSDETWHVLQHVQRESIRADLPQEEWERADTLVSLNDFRRYRNTRINPNLLVGHGWADSQLFREPLVAITYDHSDQPIGAVLTADNTSSNLSKPFNVAECWAKMLLHPGLDVPKVGGKRYVHFREGYVHPDVHEAVNQEATVVSGIVLMGLARSLQERHSSQNLTAYILPADPADQSMVNLTRAIGMQPTEKNRHGLPGFDPAAQLMRVQASVKQVLTTIMELPRVN